MSIALERAPARRAVPWGAWAAVGALGASLFAALGASGASPAIGPECWLRHAAHLSCPTCGLTRSLWRLAHGDLAASLALHPWGPVLAAQLLLGWAQWGLWLGGRLRARPDRELPRTIAIHALALLALWLVRLLTGTLPPAS